MAVAGDESIVVTLPEAMTAGTVAVEGPKIKGPPILPWMRNPAEINAHEPKNLSKVPLLDSRSVLLQLILLREFCFALFDLSLVSLFVWTGCVNE